MHEPLTCRCAPAHPRRPPQHQRVSCFRSREGGWLVDWNWTFFFILFLLPHTHPLFSCYIHTYIHSCLLGCSLVFLSGYDLILLPFFFPVLFLFIYLFDLVVHHHHHHPSSSSASEDRNPNWQLGLFQARSCATGTSRTRFCLFYVPMYVCMYVCNKR